MCETVESLETLGCVYRTSYVENVMSVSRLFIVELCGRTRVNFCCAAGIGVVSVDRVVEQALEAVGDNPGSGPLWRRCVAFEEAQVWNLADMCRRRYDPRQLHGKPHIQTHSSAGKPWRIRVGFVALLAWVLAVLLACVVAVDVTSIIGIVMIYLCPSCSNVVIFDHFTLFLSPMFSCQQRFCCTSLSSCLLMPSLPAAATIALLSNALAFRAQNDEHSALRITRLYERAFGCRLKELEVLWISFKEFVDRTPWEKLESPVLPSVSPNDAVLANILDKKRKVNTGNSPKRTRAWNSDYGIRHSGASGSGLYHTPCRPQDPETRS